VSRDALYDQYFVAPHAELPVHLRPWWCEGAFPAADVALGTASPSPASVLGIAVWTEWLHDEVWVEEDIQSTQLDDKNISPAILLRARMQRLEHDRRVSRTDALLHSWPQDGDGISPGIAAALVLSSSPPQAALSRVPPLRGRLPACMAPVSSFGPGNAAALAAAVSGGAPQGLLEPAALSDDDLEEDASGGRASVRFTWGVAAGVGPSVAAWMKAAEKEQGAGEGGAGICTLAPVGDPRVVSVPSATTSPPPSALMHFWKFMRMDQTSAIVVRTMGSFTQIPLPMEQTAVMAALPYRLPSFDPLLARIQPSDTGALQATLYERDITPAHIHQLPSTRQASLRALATVDVAAAMTCLHANHLLSPRMLRTLGGHCARWHAAGTRRGAGGMAANAASSPPSLMAALEHVQPLTAVAAAARWARGRYERRSCHTSHVVAHVTEFSFKQVAHIRAQQRRYFWHLAHDEDRNAWFFELTQRGSGDILDGGAAPPAADHMLALAGRSVADVLQTLVQAKLPLQARPQSPPRVPILAGPNACEALESICEHLAAKRADMACQRARMLRLAGEIIERRRHAAAAAPTPDNGDTVAGDSHGDISFAMVLLALEIAVATADVALGEHHVSTLRAEIEALTSEANRCTAAASNSGASASPGSRNAVYKAVTKLSSRAEELENLAADVQRRTETASKKKTRAEQRLQEHQQVSEHGAAAATVRELRARHDKLLDEATASLAALFADIERLDFGLETGHEAGIAALDALCEARTRGHDSMRSSIGGSAGGPSIDSDARLALSNNILVQAACATALGRRLATEFATSRAATADAVAAALLAQLESETKSKAKKKGKLAAPKAPAAAKAKSEAEEKNAEQDGESKAAVVEVVLPPPPPPAAPSVDSARVREEAAVHDDNAGDDDEGEWMAAPGGRHRTARAPRSNAQPHAASWQPSMARPTPSPLQASPAQRHVNGAAQRPSGVVQRSSDVKRAVEISSMASFPALPTKRVPPPAVPAAVAQPSSPPQSSVSPEEKAGAAVNEAAGEGVQAEAVVTPPPPPQSQPPTDSVPAPAPVAESAPAEGPMPAPPAPPAVASLPITAIPPSLVFGSFDVADLRATLPAVPLPPSPPPPPVMVTHGSTQYIMVPVVLSSQSSGGDVDYLCQSPPVPISGGGAVDLTAAAAFVAALSSTASRQQQP